MHNSMKPRSPLSPLCQLALLAGLVLAAFSAAPPVAGAQGVAVLVNGDPISDFDIEQRSKLMQVSGQKPASRQQVIDDLINEKLKIGVLKRYTIPDIDKDVDNAMINMARRMRQTPREFSDQLAKQGVMADTLKSRMKADIVWNQII